MRVDAGSVGNNSSQPGQLGLPKTPYIYTYPGP